MQILVMSREVAERETATNLADEVDDVALYAISITDPHSAPAKLAMPEDHILRLSFYDIDYPMKDLGGTMWYPMNADEAMQVAKFVKENIDNIGVLVVHCEAGISRSAGVAGAISKYLTGDDSFFFRNYLPNRACYFATITALRKESDED